MFIAELLLLSYKLTMITNRINNKNDVKLKYILFTETCKTFCYISRTNKDCYHIESKKEKNGPACNLNILEV